MVAASVSCLTRRAQKKPGGYRRLTGCKANTVIPCDSTGSLGKNTTLLLLQLRPFLLSLVFKRIMSQYSFVVRCRIVHCSGNWLGLAARGFFARMCAFSMCAHVSLRAHRRRAFASRASFQAWNPHCLASFGSIVRLIYIYICLFL